MLTAEDLFPIPLCTGLLIIASVSHSTAGQCRCVYLVVVCRMEMQCLAISKMLVTTVNQCKCALDHIDAYYKLIPALMHI